MVTLPTLQEGTSSPSSATEVAMSLHKLILLKTANYMLKVPSLNCFVISI
jgi:hypothetical protein